ncbi:MAG: hypothetical protein ACXAC8_12300 [Candidatus Hodarchaeales archaeon]|jgi:hypothetical protein
MMDIKHKWLSVIILIGLFSISCTQILACTIFTVIYENDVFYGNNEDSDCEGTYITFVPSQGDLHGYIWFSYEGTDHKWNGAVLGGMNDQGLCYDENSVPSRTVFASPEKPPFPPGSFYNYFFMLERFETVKDIEDLFTFYGTNYDYNMSLQAHWADVTGDAAIASVGPYGNWTFTRRNENDTYLISTNWNRAFPAESERDIASSRERYNVTQTMLENFLQEANLTVTSVRDILNAVHFEYFTQYSYVFDLVNRDIYLYYYFDFDNVLKLNLDVELEKGYQKYRIADLFKNPSSSTMSSSSITTPPPPTTSPFSTSSSPTQTSLRTSSDSSEIPSSSTKSANLTSGWTILLFLPFFSLSIILRRKNQNEY